MSKILNDSIHGNITLHPLLFKIIDTPQFQRLRNIKQLGGCYFVYPGASHNRFEHSIGTCHLASKLANQLQSKLQEDVKMTKKDNPKYVERLEKAEMSDKDKLCIEIAALCHDLGHGPYSHLFDRMFPEAMEKKDVNFKSWKHEQVSRDMFDYMIKQNDSLANELNETFKLGNPDTWDNFEKSLEAKEDKAVVNARKEFIKNLIDGKGCTDNSRRYMYEIVANKLNAIDVDKMEYFARDCHGLGIRNTFDHLRFISQCRIMFHDSDNITIAVRDKEELNLYELFHTRNGLFRRAYQHPVTHGIQLMIADALVEANEKLLFSIKNAEKIEKIRMSDAWDDMSVYEQLTDSVVDLILMHEDEKGMKKAKDLIHRIYKRQLYKLVGKTDPKANVTEQKLIDIENELLQDEELFTKDDFKVQNVTEQKLIDIENELLQDEELFTKDDFKVQKLTFSYGMKQDNPITSVYFYKKGSFECFPGEEPKKTSLFLPSGDFQEEIVFVYSTIVDDDKTFNKLSWKWDVMKIMEDAKDAMKIIEDAKDALKKNEDTEDVLKKIEDAEDAMKKIEDVKNAMKKIKDTEDALKKIKGAKDALKIIENARNALTKDAKKPLM